MSQDLFAAFGDFGADNSTALWADEPKPQQVSPSNDNLQNVWALDNADAQQQQSVLQTDTTLDDDDDFGDFEDAAASTAADPRSNHQGFETRPSPASTSTPHVVEHKPPVSKSTPKSPVKSSSTMASVSQGNEDENVGRHPFAGRMDFLFEAGDDEYDAGIDELGDLSTNPEAAVAYSKRIIAQQEAAQARLNQSIASRPSSATPTARESPSYQSAVVNTGVKSIHAAPKDPNVLFDADNLSEEEDEFDEFETGDTTEPDFNPKTKESMPSVDLLGLGDIPQLSNNVQTNGKSSRGQSFAYAEGQHLNRPPPSQAVAPTQQEDEVWDDFEIAESSSSQAGPGTLSASSNILNLQSKTPKPPTDQPELPPTNIPPPAFLLSLFPGLFAEADEALFNVISKLDVKQKQMLLAHPASHQFLKSYLGHCIVLARIIAGRKLRWKRDQRLSQSMRIGPAAGGGKGGMKLTGVDKSEVAKEDREVLDVLKIWKAQVGKLRTAVTAASSAPAVAKLPSVPEISEQMPVKSLKAYEGGITAPHPCALCGLKREERVGRVDVEVEDNFGEWWVQGMNMHLTCQIFWGEFESKLKSR